jgi:tetratricopeptide (TPR) repeat protein
MAAAFVLQWAAVRIEAKSQAGTEASSQTNSQIKSQSRSKWRVLPVAAFALIPLLGLESMSQMVWWQSNKTLFTRAFAITPENPKALVALGTAYMAERRYQDGLPLLRRALEIEPRNSAALFALGRMAWEVGDDAGAANYLMQALRIQPRYDMWLHLASIELHRNRLDAAEAAVRQAAAMNADGPGVHIAMGTVLLQRGDKTAAAREFREELRLHPQSEPALAGLAQATGNSPR